MWKELEREEVEDFADSLQGCVQDMEENLKQCLELDEEQSIRIEEFDRYETDKIGFCVNFKGKSFDVIVKGYREE